MRSPVVYVGFSTVGQPTPPWVLQDIELVKRDLLNHLHTRRGDRVMRPDWGTRIFDLLMEPFDDVTRQLVVEDVENVINHDPRVELNNIQVTSLEHILRVEAMLTFRPQDTVELLKIEYDRRNQERF